MNWEKIKKDYPLSWGKIEKWASKTWPLDPRDLYDFFDDNGLSVSIVVIDDYGGFGVEIYKPRGVEYVHFDWIAVFESDFKKGFKTRKEAETAAFTKAFEILEERLIYERL